MDIINTHQTEFVLGLPRVITECGLGSKGTPGHEGTQKSESMG